MKDIFHPCFCLAFLLTHRDSCCIRGKTENSPCIFGKGMKYFSIR
jgi:hypothetical protein